MTDEAVLLVYYYFVLEGLCLLVEFFYFDFCVSFLPFRLAYFSTAGY